MATELATRAEIIAPFETITIEQLKWMQNQVHQLLKEVLQEGLENDYAKIPGTKRYSLLKPGAEKICNLFRFVPTIPKIEERWNGDDVTYRATVCLSTAGGRLLGEGIGSASTKESKFAWRKAVCTEEWEAADYDQRRIKWYVDDQSGQAGSILQVREPPADKENNILKIAKKRALIDAVLTITGTSNLFTQDREDDLDPGQNGNGNGKPASKKTPAPAADNGPTISDKQSGRFYGIWKNANRTAEDVKLYLKRKCGVEDSRKMPVKFYDEACRWAATQEPVPAEAPAAAKEEAPKQEVKLSPEQEEAKTAFSILGWDEKTQARFIDQYKGDWKVILGELKILVTKRNDNF